MFKALSGLLISCALLAIGSVASDAHAQSKGYDVTAYDATISLDRDVDSIHGEVTMYATAQLGLAEVPQYALDLVIDSVFVDQKIATATLPDSVGEFYVRPTSPIAAGSQFTVRTVYHGRGRNEGGPHPWGGVTDSTGMMFAMGVGLTAPYISCTRNWLPCYDLPDDKADSVDLIFSVPDSDVVASNGSLVGVTSKDGRKSYHWHVSHPISTYLLTFATGDFQKLSIPNSLTLPFEVYAFAKDTLAADREMTTHVAPALAFFDSLYGHYPFEKVGYVLAPFGSMEHQTMITLDHSGLTASSTTAQHELSHQWWGDWVTCRTFDDAWLNEGFATYSESLIKERFTSKGAYWSAQHTNINSAISGGSSIALYGAPNHTTPRDNYPYQVIYQKGAAVLGMLRYFLGDSLFFGGLRYYGGRHAYSTATSYDLWHDLEAFTKQDLGWFFKPWVFGIGYPQLKIGWRNVSGMTQIQMEQVQDTSLYNRFRLPITIEAHAAGKTPQRAIVWLDSAAITSTSYAFDFAPDTLVIDPDRVLIKTIVSLSPLRVGESLGKSSGIELRIINNPVRAGRLTVSLGAPRTIGEVQLSIVSETGSTIRELSKDTLRASEAESSFSVPDLANGAYFLVASDGKGSSSVAKFTVVH